MLRTEWHGLRVSQIVYLVGHCSHTYQPHPSTRSTMHYACAFCSCAQLALYVQVKIVNSKKYYVQVA